MKSLLKRFKEVNDPTVLRYLTIGFACLCVAVFLTFFIAAPGFRENVLHPHIGLFDNEPVTREHKPSPPKKGNTVSGSKKNGGGSDSSRPSNGSSPGQKGNGTKSPSSNGGGDNPSNGGKNNGSDNNPSGNHPGSGNPAPAPNPVASPAANPSSPGKSEGNGKSEDSNGGASVGVEAGGAKVEAEIVVPDLTVPPVVEEAGKGVSDTVNGITKEVPLPVEVPKVCLPNCHE